MTAGRRTADVAIVGFGPIGAVLAGLLGRRGLDVVVFEREVGVFTLPRAAHIDHQGLRVLQELGCLDGLLGLMRPNPGMDFLRADRTLLLRIPSDGPSRSGLPASMYFHQPAFDVMIRNVVAGMPNVSVHLATDVTAAVDRGDSVTVRAVGLDGVDRSVHARYVVGCDGTRSSVRSWLGVDVDDLGFEEQWLVVDVILDSPVAGLPERAVHLCDPVRPHTVVPMPEPRYRFEFMMLPGEDPTKASDPAYVDALMSPWIPPGRARLERSAAYTFGGRVAHDWRVGRILLAGDAAHQMPPFLGQGMCSGMRDAANLAWKLDHVLRLGAPDELLDTYTMERRPHVRAIVDAAVEFGRVICTLDPLEAARRDRDFLACFGREPNFGLPPLQPGPLVLAGGGELALQPDVDADLPRLDDMVGQRFLVLARSEDALGRSASWWKEALGAAVLTVEDVPDPRGSLRRHFDRAAIDVQVIRPDRYVLAGGRNLDTISAQVTPKLVRRQAAA